MISCTRCSTLIAPEDPACPHCGTEVARVTTAAPEGPPDLPARYPIQQLLGRGGMGRVYLCRDHDLDVDVAVKVLPPAIAGNPRSLQRIESEAKVAARLRGLPGILSLYGFERHGPSCLLVMEYAAGARAASPRPAAGASAPRSPTPSPRPTGTACSTATSSPATCSSTSTGG